MKAVPPRVDVAAYRGQWVALHPATHAVIGHDRSLPEAQRQAREQGVEKPLLLPVPKERGYFVGRS